MTGEALVGEGLAEGGGLFAEGAGAAALSTTIEILTGPVGWAILAGTVIVGAAYLYKAHQQSQALSSSAAEPCLTCDEDKDPCKSLRKGNGTGKYRGGAHGETKKPLGDGLDSHHMPAASANKLAGGPSRNNAPAIQMDPEDHMQTQSYGSGVDQDLYRAKQAALIRDGRLLDAAKMDIEDVRRIAAESGDPTKYDQAIKEMLDYATCLQNQIDKLNDES